MMMAAEEGTRQRGMRCAQTGRCQGLEPGGQEEAERDWPGAGSVGRAGPGFLDPAGSGLVHHGSLFSVNHLIDHHPAVAQRVARLVHA